MCPVWTYINDVSLHGERISKKIDIFLCYVFPPLNKLDLFLIGKRRKENWRTDCICVSNCI